MENIFNVHEKCPSYGYILENWKTTGHRATAVAYLQREGLFAVKHYNGNYYNLTQLKNSLIKGGAMK